MLSAPNWSASQWLSGLGGEANVLTRRNHNMGGSSLELLLDTICNTFGGVLFLALLVSLMLTQTRRKAKQTTTDPTAAVSAADLVRLTSRTEDAASEVVALEEQIRQARRAAGALAVPNAEELLAEMESSERGAREAEMRRAELLTAVATEQAAAAGTAAATINNDRERERVAREAQAARERLAAAIATRDELISTATKIRDDANRRATVTTTGRPPRMRPTEKPEFGVMLKYGRLYLMKRLQDGRPVINEADFWLNPGTTANVAQPKPHAGIDLCKVEGRDAALRRIATEFPASRWYVCLVVHPDSFEQYLTAKNWLTDRGYECRLFPTDTSVVDRGSSGDVQVQ